MKSVLPLTLAVAVATEIASETLREVPRDNSHVELETTRPAQSTSTEAHLSSGGNPEPLANFRSKTFEREARRANVSKDKFAMHDAWLATARAMMGDRVLSDWQRVMQYEILKHGIETIYHRTSGKIDCYGALPALAVALRIPSCSV